MKDDETRVVLNSVEKQGNGSDYINASLIEGAHDEHYKYIAAQGPTKDTMTDFLRMITQFNVKIVICACNEFEGQRVFFINII